MHAPGKRAVVHRAAARLIAVIQDGHRVRAHAGIWPPGNWLALPVRAKLLPLEIAQLVVRVEVRSGKARAALEANDFHSRFAEFGRENSADRAHADNDDIRFFGGHGLCPPYWALGHCLQADDGFARECLFALHIRWREDGLRARETHQAPAGEVLVAAVERVGKHAFHRVRPKNTEKFARSGIREPGCVAVFEGSDHFVLLFGTEANEWLFVSDAAVGLELGEAAAVEILQLGVSAGESEIDVIEYIRVARSRLVGRAGHEAFGERGDRGGIGVVKERAMLAAAGMLRARSCGAAFHVLVILGDRVRHEASAGSGSGANGCAH